MMPYPLKNLTKDNTLIIYKILRILSTVYVQIINMKLISYETQRTIGIVKYIFLTINQTLGNKTQQTPFHAFWMYMDISKMNLLALLIVIIWLPLNPRLFFRILFIWLRGIFKNEQIRPWDARAFGLRQTSCILCSRKIEDFGRALQACYTKLICAFSIQLQVLPFFKIVFHSLHRPQLYYWPLFYSKIKPLMFKGATHLKTSRSYRSWNEMQQYAVWVEYWTAYWAIDNLRHKRYIHE